MASTTRLYRLRIRTKADDANLLILSSVVDGDNPYLTQPPDGDGQSVDPITGEPTTGTYTYRFADAETGTNTRVFTEKLADVNARQQLLALRAYGESSEDGTTWANDIPGYVLSARLTSAIEGEIQIGDTRRKEKSREIFKTATTQFPGVTCVIGGPVIGGFAGIIPDNGGWTYHVNQVASAPSYIQLKIDSGFDPRKPPYSTFSTVSSAITNFTNDWARPYWLSATDWLGASTPIQGHFPQLRVRLEPISPAYDATTNPNRLFVPLSEPEATVGPWYNPNPLGDNLMRSGTSSLWIPVDGWNADTGVAFTGFAPSVSDTFKAYVYAVPVSKDNPLHIYERPVDLWEKIRLALGYTAGVDYDDTNLADLTTSLNTYMGGDVKLALRIEAPWKVPDISSKTIYGPFRFSSRVVAGLLQLFSISVRSNPAPSTTITIDDLRSDEGTVFEVDESTVVTAVTLKEQIIRLWSSDDQDQPTADGLVMSPSPVDTIENSDDDIPAGLEHTVEIGDIPGVIQLDNADPDLIVPLPFEQYLRSIGDEIFQRFGRGGIAGEISCLPNIEEYVGQEVLVNLVHRPAAFTSQSPVSQRGGERRVQIVQRTEHPEGPTFRIVDSALEIGSGVDTGVGGGTEEETDPTGITPDDPVAFAGGGLGVYSASADWVDSYPQFSTLTQWEAHPPSDSTFNELYGGEHSLTPGTFSDSQTGIGAGYIVRMRYRLTNGIANSNWSAYSNSVTVAGTTPSVPTDVPDAPVATSVVSDTAHAEWTNTNGSLQIRINWQGSVEVSDPVVWANVAGGNRLLAATTTSDDQAMGAATFARFRVAYVNSAGVAGPYSDWSDPVAIMP